MKKRIFGFLLILALVFAFVGCGSDDAKHEAASDWKSDETNHWHECVVDGCTEKFNEAAHTFGEGVVVNEATADAAGEMKYTCTVCGYEKTEEIAKLATVSDVLTYKNNDEISITAVVYAKTANGFYVTDGTNGIYAKYSSAKATKLAALNIGDEVEVTGKFAVTNEQPFIKNADTNVVATGKATLSAKADKFETINELTTAERANFGILYTTVAAVGIDEDTKAIKLTDSTGFVYLSNDNYDDYEKYVGKKISTSFLLSSKNAAEWTVIALTDTASEYFVNVDDVKENIYTALNMPTEVIGAINLVTTYEAEPGVEFNWSVKEGTAISITNNIAAVDLTITEDASVTLTLELVSGETKATKDFTLTVKAVKKVTLAEGTAETDYVQIEALVVGAGVGDETGSYHYIIVKDVANEFYLIQVSSAVRKTVAVGDNITFVAKWVSDEDLQPETEGEKVVKRPRYSDVKAIIKNSTGNAVDYSTLDAITLETEEDYQNAATNNHDAIKLYKVVNPFMVGSGTSNYNWNRFGATSGTALNGIQSDRIFSMLIRNLAENGLDTWEADYAVPTKTVGAKQYPGTVIYVFSVYQTGDTVWSFILPCKEACYYDEAEEIKLNLKASLPEEINASEEGNYTLPATVSLGENTYDVTWAIKEDANRVYNIETGVYEMLVEPATVTVTATFTVGETQKSVDLTLNFVCAETTPVDCTTAIATAVASETGTVTIKKLEAYVATLGASSENKAEYNYGIMLTDGKRVIYFNTANLTIGEGESAHKLAVGDKVLIKKAKLTVNADEHVISDGTIELISTGNTIDYSELVIDVTVTNDTELAEFIGAHGVTRGLVVKFAGDIINFVGTGSTSATGRYQINYRAAGKSADARYTYNITENNSKSLVLNLPQTYDVTGQEWWTTCGLPEKSGSKSYEVSGSFIAVGGYYGNTMHAWSVIDANSFNLTTVSDWILAKRLIAKNAETSINAYQAGTATLLDKVTVGENEYALTWVSSDDNKLNGTTGAYAAVTEETKVIMTAHFTVGEVEYTYDVEYTLFAQEPEPLTITEATALDKDAKVTAKGAVIAFISDGNSTEANKGFLLMDNATGTIMQVRNIMTGVTYPSYTYKDTTTAIAIGDNVKVVGTVNQSGTTKFIDLGGEGDVTFVETVTLNFHEGESTSAVVTVSTDTELAALISGGNYIGKIIKINATAENTLHVSGSSTSNTCNFKLGMHYGDGDKSNQIYYSGLTISAKEDVNAPNTTGSADWAITMFGASGKTNGRLAASANKQYTGTLYIAICYTTSTYYQSSIVNYANCSLTAATN